MRRAVPMILGLGCALSLFLACFYPVLCRGHQFAYRDAGHFYYPLNQVVQQDWSAGRWPLWNPGQNAGTPLLGMPMAAVLYPGKLLYAVLPYPSAARASILAHLLIALIGAMAMARALGTGWTGAALAAFSYAFGAPVLSQYSNVIYLVGAAWMPWGFRAIHRLADPGTRWGVVELSIVLALQVLGGDPESAYLVMASGALYAAVLALARGASSTRPSRRWPASAARLLAVFATWVGLILGTECAAPTGWLPSWIAEGLRPWLAPGLSVALVGVWRSRRTDWGAMLIGLAGAGVLASMLAAAQWLPTWEYVRRSTRLAGASAPAHYDFSVEPYRLAEAAWPHVFGLEVPENATSIQAFPPAGERMIWSPSHYIGGFVLALAVAAAGLRGGPRWRSWLTALALISVAGAVGKFAGPLWWARWIPGAAGLLGGHDPAAGLPRADTFPPDGIGSVYSALAMALPGFAMFRYPAKLMVLASLCASSLAGLGWDRLRHEGSAARGTRRICLVGIAASAGLLLLVLAGRAAIERWIGRSTPPGSLYGPVDAAGAVRATVWALVQGGAVYAVGAVLTTAAPRRPHLIGAAALLMVTADLALAGSRIVWTVPQSDLDGVPQVAALIDRAERSDPAPGPFRIHRVEQWHPDEFSRRRSPRRLSELVAWEHDTLDRLHAEPYSLAYTVIRGVIDVEEYLDFFEARGTWGRDDQGVRRPIYSFPRGGYDLWNARYFLMPVGLNGWMGPERGFARIAPSDEVVGDPVRARQWIERQGWQLLRNLRAFPRCWLVASAVIIPPTAPGSPERAELVRTLVDSAGGAATDGGRGTVDLRRTAFVEAERPGPLAALRGARPAGPVGSVAIVRAESQRIEIRAALERPGLVILADLFDPGWHLTIDGAPASIWRTNRMMRGAFVPAGEHRLVYTYRPGAFRRGALVSLAGLIGLIGLIGRASGGGDVRAHRPPTPDGERLK
jgi:hypothetical protein